MNLKYIITITNSCLILIGIGVEQFLYEKKYFLYKFKWLYIWLYIYINTRISITPVKSNYNSI